MYKIIILPTADRDIKTLKKSEPAAFKKVMQLVLELEEHPSTGTGHPKPLGSDRSGQWSRRIDKKHRLIYRIDDDVITVLVLSAYGHYEER